MFHSFENIIYFSGKLSGDPMPIIGRLFSLIHKTGVSDIVLDFSDATFIAPPFMLPIVTTCRSYRYEKVTFEIIMPKDKKMASLLERYNWAHIIWPEKYASSYVLNGKDFPATQFFTAEEHYAAVDKTIDILLSVASGMDRDRIKALEWSLNEITDNVLNHAESAVGGIMQMVTYPKNNRVEFIVCDSGITIQKSLRSGNSVIDSDLMAVRKAIEEGVTKNKKTNQGNGLFGTSQCCVVSGGEFEIMSGRISLIKTKGSLIAGKKPIPFKGTIVRASINTLYEDLLEDALIFQGKKYTPSFDYIEKEYLDDRGILEFKIADEVASFGSREIGKLARTKIENLMDNYSQIIDFDFEGVSLISSSFADEVFGKIYLQIGEKRFYQLVRIKNADRAIKGLIDRAIEQRSQPVN